MKPETFRKSYITNFSLTKPTEEPESEEEVKEWALRFNKRIRRF